MAGSNRNFLYSQFSVWSFLPTAEVGKIHDKYSHYHRKPAPIEAAEARITLVDDLLELEQDYPNADPVDDLITREVIIEIRDDLDKYEEEFYSENSFNTEYLIDDFYGTLVEQLNSLRDPNHEEWADNWCGSEEQYDSQEHYEETKGLFAAAVQLVQTSLVEARVRWLEEYLPIQKNQAQAA
jgi:hypothetical protein